MSVDDYHSTQCSHDLCLKNERQFFHKFSFGYSDDDDDDDEPSQESSLEYSSEYYKEYGNDTSTDNISLVSPPPPPPPTSSSSSLPLPLTLFNFVDKIEQSTESRENYHYHQNNTDIYPVETDWTIGKTFQVNINDGVNVIFEEDYKQGNRGRLVPIDPSEEQDGIIGYFECILDEKPLCVHQTNTYYFSGSNSIRPRDLVDEIFSECDIGEYYEIELYNLDQVEPIYVIPRKNAIKGINFIDLKRYKKFKVTASLSRPVFSEKKQHRSKKLYVNKIHSSNYLVFLLVLHFCSILNRVLHTQTQTQTRTCTCTM